MQNRKCMINKKYYVLYKSTSKYSLKYVLLMT